MKGEGKVSSIRETWHAGYLIAGETVCLGQLQGNREVASCKMEDQEKSSEGKKKGSLPTALKTTPRESGKQGKERSPLHMGRSTREERHLRLPTTILHGKGGDVPVPKTSIDLRQMFGRNHGIHFGESNKSTSTGCRGRDPTGGGGMVAANSEHRSKRSLRQGRGGPPGGGGGGGWG